MPQYLVPELLLIQRCVAALDSGPDVGEKKTQ